MLSARSRRVSLAFTRAAVCCRLHPVRYGQVLVKQEDKVPEESGKYKMNRRKHAGHNRERNNIAAQFFKGGPRRREDDGGRGYGRGRGRGGDGRGRGRGAGRSRGRGGYRSYDSRNGSSRGAQVPKTTDMSEFPSLG